MKTTFSPSASVAAVAAEQTLLSPIRLEDLSVKIFADGADAAAIRELSHNPLVSGFTTNPTLMRKAGVADYEAFSQQVLQFIDDRPISFEVFADEFEEMYRQALKIASWGPNVYVKVPIMNTKGVSTATLLRRLVAKRVQVNVTALMTCRQVQAVLDCLADGPASYVSVFAGRIADSGRDPIPVMLEALEIIRGQTNIELIWASPREVLNIVQADQIGCHVITVTPDLLKKLPTVGRDLNEFSLDTVRMFHRDAQQAGYIL